MKTLRIIAIIVFAAKIFCLQAQTITIHKVNGAKLEYHCGEVDSIVNYQIMPETEKHEAVDLGLSVLWATCNVGAEKPYQKGNEYAWGETVPKEDGSKDNYWFYNKETGLYEDLGKDISGTIYDAARQEWGGSWRMPTETEMIELLEKCKWEYITILDVYQVTGTNGNYIFMPLFAAPNASNYFLTRYWSSTIKANVLYYTYSHCISLYAYYDSFGFLDDKYCKMGLESIENCACIRPVKNK